jgi:hypothetical protein
MSTHESSSPPWHHRWWKDWNPRRLEFLPAVVGLTAGFTLSAGFNLLSLGLVWFLPFVINLLLLRYLWLQLPLK